jgi:hypothetical protein
MFNFLSINQVQPVHSTVTQKLCNRDERNADSAVFMRYSSIRITWNPVNMRPIPLPFCENLVRNQSRRDVCL